MLKHAVKMLKNAEDDKLCENISEDTSENLGKSGTLFEKCLNQSEQIRKIFRKCVPGHLGQIFGK